MEQKIVDERLVIEFLKDIPIPKDIPEEALRDKVGGGFEQLELPFNPVVP
ncbi:MAG: hypothetical protein HY001_02250 [Candidatus Portnoybacteria bacterium]|nr:hypothetical protein [Candidatus Portnoybacteria bacterium]